MFLKIYLCVLVALQFRVCERLPKSCSYDHKKEFKKSCNLGYSAQGCEKLFNPYWIFEETNKVRYSPSLYHHPGLQGVAGGNIGQGPGSLEEHRIGLLLVRWGYAQKGHQFRNWKYSKIDYGMGNFFRSYYGATHICYLVNFCRKYLNRIDTNSMLVNCEATKDKWEIFSNFCGLLRIYELWKKFYVPMPASIKTSIGGFLSRDKIFLAACVALKASLKSVEKIPVLISSTVSEGWRLVWSFKGLLTSSSHVFTNPDFLIFQTAFFLPFEQNFH